MSKQRGNKVGVRVMQALNAAPLPVVLLVASFLAPTELSLFVGGLRLPPHRIALLLLILPAVWRMATRPDIRIHAFDVLMVLFNVWTVVVFVHHGGQPDGAGGQSDGLVFGGSLALESLASYLVARAWIRDLTQFRATLRMLVIAVTAAGLIALPEMLLGRHFTHDLLQALTGYEHPRGIEQRLGLTRAYGPFDHPIHLGTFCASLFALVWYVERNTVRTWTRLDIVTLATFTALSSAPLLCIGAQIVLIAWERATRGVPSRVALTLAALGGLYLGTQLVGTRSPIAWIATGMTLDSWTGYYRLLIWDYGTDNVLANPWLGIGLADWERPQWMVAATVDAMWLVIAMRGGIPSIVLVLLAVVLLGRVVGRKGARSRDIAVRRVARGWLISLVALSLAACTVHYWNAIYAYFFFFLGLGGWLADPRRQLNAVRVPGRNTTIERRLEPVLA